jgi:hypothetical protein
MSTKYHCDGFMPCLIWPDNVRSAATEVQVLADDVNRQVGGCTSLKQTTRDAWAEFYTALTAFLADAYQAFFGLGQKMEDIARWSDDLYGWQQRLVAEGCTGGPPVVDPNALRPSEEWTYKLAQWGLYAVIVAAGAYVVGEVAFAVGEAVSVIPKPAPRRVAEDLRGTRRRRAA